MLVMLDENASGPSRDNLRTLFYFLGLIVDHKLTLMRKDTPYKGVRPSDARVFVTAARDPKTISAIARDLHITRQSVQMSVHRLMKLGVLQLEALPGNKRDKQVVLTQRGVLARTTAGKQIAQVENEFAKVIGSDSLENLRQSLAKLVAANMEDFVQSKPGGG